MYMCRSLALGCFAQLPRFVCIFWATTSSIIEWRWIQAWCIVQNRPQSMLLTYENLSELWGGCITLSSYFPPSANCHWPILMRMMLLIPPSHCVNQWNSAQTINPDTHITSTIVNMMYIKTLMITYLSLSIQLAIALWGCHWYFAPLLG